MKTLNKVMLVTNQNTNFCPNVTAVADAEVENWYQDILKQTESWILISTQVQLLRLRVGALEGEITPFELWVDYEKFTDCDSNGKLSKHPDQFNANVLLLAKLSRAKRRN